MFKVVRQKKKKSHTGYVKKIKFCEELPENWN